MSHVVMRAMTHLALGSTLASGAWILYSGERLLAGAWVPLAAQRGTAATPSMTLLPIGTPPACHPVDPSQPPRSEPLDDADHLARVPPIGART